MTIGVNRPGIVREIPHFAFFPAVPHFWLYFEKNKFAETRDKCPRHGDILCIQCLHGF